MAAPITSSSFARALYPGIRKWYVQGRNDHPVEYTMLFDTEKSRRAYEELMSSSWFGTASVIPEGGAISFDTAQQGFITRATHITYGLGFMITRNMVDDDQYDIVAKKRATSLARSMRHTKELVGANIYNRAVNASYTGGDGVSLLSASHPYISGGTYSNLLSGTPALSEAALEDICIQIGGALDDRGLKAALQPYSLHIPIDLEFEAERILKTVSRVGTADNDLNAVKALGKFPGGVHMNHWFSSTDAWFVRTKGTEAGMIYFERRPDDFTMDNDWHTDNAMYKATGRYSFVWADPMSVYGSHDGT